MKKERVFKLPEHSLRVDRRKGIIELVGRSRKPKDEKGKYYSCGPGRRDKSLELFARLVSGEAVEYKPTMVSMLTWIEQVLDLICRDHGVLFSLGSINTGKTVVLNLHEVLEVDVRKQTKRPRSK